MFDNLKNEWFHSLLTQEDRTTQWTIHQWCYWYLVAFARLLLTSTKSSELIFVKFSWTATKLSAVSYERYFTATVIRTKCGKKCGTD